jgi:hypothetical protein
MKVMRALLHVLSFFEKIFTDSMLVRNLRFFCKAFSHISLGTLRRISCLEVNSAFICRRLPLYHISRSSLSLIVEMMSISLDTLTSVLIIPFTTMVSMLYGPISAFVNVAAKALVNSPFFHNGKGVALLQHLGL